MLLTFGWADAAVISQARISPAITTAKRHQADGAATAMSSGNVVLLIKEVVLLAASVYSLKQDVEWTFLSAGSATAASELPECKMRAQNVMRNFVSGPFLDETNPGPCRSKACRALGAVWQARPKVRVTGSSRAG